MTDEELRKLDMVFAEKVLGYVWMRYAGRPEETGEGYIETHLWSPEEWEGFDKGKDGDRGRYMLDDGKYPREELPSYGRVPRFTKQLDRAIQAVEKLRMRFALFYDPVERMWNAVFKDFYEQAETAPLAICLSALKHVERMKKEKV
jgi:hypothetical protein